MGTKQVLSHARFLSFPFRFTCSDAFGFNWDIYSEGKKKNIYAFLVIATVCIKKGVVCGLSCHFPPFFCGNFIVAMCDLVT